MTAAGPTAARAPGGRGLHRYVQRIDVRMPRTGESQRFVDHLPDGTTNLVFRILGGASDAGVRGPCTSALHKIASATPVVVHVVFRPGGAYPFFGIPVDALADRMVQLETLWGPKAAETIERLVAAVARGRDVVGIVEDALYDRMQEAPFEPASALTARAAVALLARRHVSIEAAAGELGISARHLRRAFQAAVGVSPKTYARIARFQRALALGRTKPNGRWTEVAHTAGYFDQAHLTADFRDLALVPPGAVGTPRTYRAC